MNIGELYEATGTVMTCRQECKLEQSLWKTICTYPITQ